MTKKYRIDRAFFPWLGAHFLEFWSYYLMAFLSLYLLHTFQSQIPEMAKELGDLLISGKEASASIWPFLALALAIVVFRTASRLLFFYPARVQQKLIRIELLEKLKKSHPDNYNSYSDGQIFQIFNEDINRLRGFVGFGLLQVGNIIIAFSIFIPKINKFNPDLLVAFFPLVIGVLIFSCILIAFQKYLKKSMEASGDVQNFLIESYEGKQTIKNFHSEYRFLSKFSKLVGIEMDYFFKGSLGPTLSLPMIKLSLGISLLWGAYLIKEQNLGASSLIFFSSFLFLVAEPIGFLSWIGVVITSALAAWRRIKELLVYLDHSGPGFEGQILFWEQKIAPEIEVGKWSVFTGETGVGKSYLLRKVADNLKAQKKKMSLVAQEPYLFNDSLLNNVILGQEFTPELEEKVKTLVSIFSLEHLGRNINEVFRLELGENGKKVSGGQAKRIALMRSLVSDANYLLWDDPFSSVDLILEQKIISALKENGFFQNKTLVMTSHRLSSVRYCDYIFLLGKEGIIEEGQAQDLLAKESKVSRYFEKQMA